VVDIGYLTDADSTLSESLPVNHEAERRAKGMNEVFGEVVSGQLTSARRRSQ
jgi:hypothetical protein